MLGRIGTYEIIGLLGRGGMGVVFKAFDAVLNRYVAIKLLAPLYLASGAAKQRFVREARSAAAVIHENVVGIHAISEWQGIPYLVMTFIRGESLQKRLAQRGALSVKEVLRIGLQVTQGLAAAHAQGLIHRDIKPANILLETEVERVKITDFGLARAIDDIRMTASDVLLGTPEYMSPEQARDEPSNRHLQFGCCALRGMHGAIAVPGIDRLRSNSKSNRSVACAGAGTECRDARLDGRSYRETAGKGSSRPLFLGGRCRNGLATMFSAC